MHTLRLVAQNSTNEQAIEHLEKVRWRAQAVLPVLATANVDATPWRPRPPTLAVPQLCSAFAATVGTIFHGTHIPLRNWSLTISLMMRARSVSAYQISRDIGVRRATVSGMMQRIRLANCRGKRSSRSAAQPRRDSDAPTAYAERTSSPSCQKSAEVNGCDWNVGQRFHEHVYYGDNIHIMQERWGRTVMPDLSRPAFSGHELQSDVQKHDGQACSQQVVAFSDTWELDAAKEGVSQGNAHAHEGAWRSILYVDSLAFVG